jgi:urease accessory protein
MSTELLRLLHLVSPTLPIGAFTYSQGIEWAVEIGWIRSPDDVTTWMIYQLQTSIRCVDIPILKQCYAAITTHDRHALEHWIAILHASRETHELLLEEKQRGRALTDLLCAWKIPIAMEWKSTLAKSQLAAFAVAAMHEHITLETAAQGYVWSWLENMVLSAVKLIPLGQTAGQCILYQLVTHIPETVISGLALPIEDMGASSPALAIASSRHETQYTRLFRS